MRRLKADFHTHTSDDPWDGIGHSAEMLIDAAARKALDVLAITCHGACVFNGYLSAYARRRGLLLIPGMEAFIEQKHVLILNPDTEQARARTFEELRLLGRRDAAFVAPHPFFPSKVCLHRRLGENIDLFDAIEYTSFYLPGMNFNRAAMRAARRYGLPMVGCSDTHALPYQDSTFTWVDADPSIESVIGAIRKGKVSVETRPRPVPHMANVFMNSVRDAVWTHRNGAKNREAVG